jgi:ankyrin repeat protein
MLAGPHLAAGYDKENTNADGVRVTPLLTSAFKGHEWVELQLLATGCDKDRADHDGNTSLHVAVQMGHEGVVWEQMASSCHVTV